MRIIKCNTKGNVGCGIPEIEVENIAGELKAGKLIVYPTETLYGLGANAFDESAVKHVFVIKKRPFDMPLSVAVSSIEMLESVAVLDRTSRKLVQKLMPGPITLIITKKPNVPDIVTSGSDEVGIRMPDHPLALEIIKRAGPITSTSANLHSRPDPTTVGSMVKELGDAVSTYIDCGKTKLGKPSTIVAVHEGEIEIIRSGVVTKKEIEAALNG
jgi:L-threonylcarbamoyladenylate synthase